jgi:hypothetical protein
LVGRQFINVVDVEPPVAENATNGELPSAVIQASRVLLPATMVHSVEATPAASVVAVVGATLPPPLATWKVTPAPLIGLPC